MYILMYPNWEHIYPLEYISLKMSNACINERGSDLEYEYGLGLHARNSQRGVHIIFVTFILFNYQGKSEYIIGIILFTQLVTFTHTIPAVLIILLKRRRTTKRTVEPTPISQVGIVSLISIVHIQINPVFNHYGCLIKEFIRYYTF